MHLPPNLPIRKQLHSRRKSPPISKKIKAFFSRQSLFPAKYKTFPSKDAHLSRNFQASFKQLIVCFVPEDRHKSTKRQAKTEQITPFSALF